MVSIAARTRPTVAGALLVTGIAVVPWMDDHIHREKVPETRATESTDRMAHSSDHVAGEIVLTPWDRVQLGPQHFEVLVPPTHPDARDYPLGMVMGRNTPSVDPGIQVWFGSPLANVLSVFLAPWQALAHQLGT